MGGANGTYDRAAEDIGNIVALEHVNVTVPDQRLATLFYVTGLGLTRDPYLTTGVTNMWINAGRNQFHLPTRAPQVLRGRIGLVMPELASLKRRLKNVGEMLADTAFSYTARRNRVDIVCPWGNRFRVHAADEASAPVNLGLTYVMFDVPPGTSDGIARFYRDCLMAPSSTGRVENAKATSVRVGFRQSLIFRETNDTLPDYDGHHIQVYVADFSGPHRALLERGLVTEESSQHQYRFLTISDPDDGTELFEIEHEVRSMTHPLYARPLVNRAPDQDFAQGHESRSWAMPPGTD